MIHLIYPCLWFNGQISEATQFYTSLFKESSIHAENAMISKFEIEGTPIKLLNGGALFTKNASISLFVKCSTQTEVETLYQAFMEGGKVLMPLGAYEWSSLYAWVEDKYGMSWQLFLTALAPGEQKIMPSMLFTNEVFGSAKEAMHFYTSVFKENKVFTIDQYNEPNQTIHGKLKFGYFEVLGAQFAIMDGPGEHLFQFNEGISFVIECDGQEQVDYYWDQLSAGGYEGQCGWLKDKFGISWQVLPKALNQLMSNPQTAEKARNAFTKMNKLIIKDLY
jgi:predicted 3-demethylubiquinone-9 3-methyltransferase (glyoxalase superfamily)